MRYVEKTKRGVFGWIVKITFILFQFLMLMWFINYSSSVGEHFQNIDNEAGKAGATIGAGLAYGFLGGVWVGGTVILGIPLMLTRRKEMVAVED